MHNLSPVDWALRPLKNYADFSGRASRAEFWWFFLFMMLFYFVVWVIFVAIIASIDMPRSHPSVAIAGILGAFGIAAMLSYIALLIPVIAVQVRRLHDTDRSGWWLGAFWLLYASYFVVMFSRFFSGFSADSPPSLYGAGAVGLFALAMVIYSVLLLVFWCLPGTRGANRYGEDPYGANVEEVFA